MSKIHQIKIDFNVTSEIKRYVYVYLIEGKYCYLIDSGVDGSEEKIKEYLKSLGRDIKEIKGIFLTHSHPDHIGSAGKIKEMTSCDIYASYGEKEWIENIDLQYKNRPIPNFYKLVNKSVDIDIILKDNDKIELESGLTLKAISTKGHSADGLAYILEEEKCIFTGDAIPIRGDIPIWINKEENKKTLEKLEKLQDINIYYPAWDIAYDKETAHKKIQDGILLMSEMEKCVNKCKKSDKDLESIAKEVCNEMNTPWFLNNPLFKKTVYSML